MIIPKRTLTLMLAGVASLLAVFYFGIRIIRSPGREVSENPAQESSESEQSPLPVRVAEVERGELVINIRTSGKAVAVRKTVIRSETGGRLKSLLVEEGQSIEKGDLLAELENRDALLDLEEAEASRLRILSEILLEKKFSEPEAEPENVSADELEKARRDYEISASRFRQGFLSETEWEKALKEYELVLIGSGQKKDEILAAAKGLTQQEIRVEAAQIQLEKTRITAPISGMIANVRVSEKQQVSASAELFTLVDNSRVVIEARVLESEIRTMSPGKQARLRFNAYPGEVFWGQVQAVSPIVDSEDKTCRVVISLLSPNREIKQGMTSDVEIEAEVHSGRLLVPRAAILLQSGKKTVFVVKDGVAVRTIILTGLENEKYAEVISGAGGKTGLEEGDLVITEGHFTLARDASVRIVE